MGITVDELTAKLDQLEDGDSEVGHVDANGTWIPFSGEVVARDDGKVGIS